MPPSAGAGVYPASWPVERALCTLEDEEEQGLVPGQHDVLHGAVHGAHLLRGGSQEGQRPDALLRA